MPGTDVFGPIIAATDVEDAVEATLRKWLSTYLMAIEDRAGIDRGTIARPRAWRVDEDVRKLAETQLPVIVIASTGVDQVEGQGDGTMAGDWETTVGVAVKGPNRPDRRRLSRWYTAAIRACLMQKPDLGGLADGMWWVGESWQELPSSNRGTNVAAGSVVFTVTTMELLDRFAGPSQPEPEPEPPDSDGWPNYPDNAEVTDVSVTVDQTF